MARLSSTRARHASSFTVSAALALAVLCVLALALVGSRADARRDLEERFADRAVSTASLVDALLASSATASARSAIGRVTRSRLETVARSSRAAYVLVAERNGRVLAATAGSPSAAAARAGRAATALTAASAPAYLLYPTTHSGRDVLEIAFPVRGRVHVVAVPVGVWAGFFDATLDRAVRPAETRVLITDGAGRVYGDSGSGPRPRDPVTAEAAVGRSPLKVVYVTGEEQLYRPIGGRRAWAAWIALAVAALAMGGGLWLLVRLRRSHVALRRSEERYALAMRAANDALWDWDLGTGQVHYSQRWDDLTGRPEATGIERWLELVHPEDRPRLDGAIAAHLAGETPILDHEHRLRAAGGDWMWALVRGLAVFDEHGRAVRIAGSLSDVTARRRALEHLEHQATHDPLTGLANRARFLCVLERSLERARRGEQPPCAVVFLDLDGFKQVNDGYGHVFGDAVLATVGARLLQCVRPGDVVGRLGGDELAVLLPRCESLEEARAVAERLAESMRQPYEVLGEVINVSASAGVAVSEPDETAEQLLREADAAMYRAKLAV